MDELKLRLSTKFMRNIVAKMIGRMIYKKFGYKINIQLNELDLNIIDGDVNISTNVELKINNKEFMKIIKESGLED